MKRVFWWLRRLAFVLPAAWLVVCVLLAAVVHYTGTVDRAVRSDVIVVLGAALSSDGTPYRALTRRSEHAAELWKKGIAARVICTGGIGRELRVPRSEADGCREVLMRAGVPRTAIFLEETSTSTEENALNARKIMVGHDWDSAVLVTDSYHAFRARHVVRRLGIDVALSPVPVAKIQSPLFYLFSVVREVMALQWHALR